MGGRKRHAKEAAYAPPRAAARTAKAGRDGEIEWRFRMLSDVRSGPKAAGPGGRSFLATSLAEPAVPAWARSLGNLTLPPAPPGVGLSPDAGGLALGHEVAVGFQFPEDAAHLHHFLETAQQRFLGLAFMYGYF